MLSNGNGRAPVERLVLEAPDPRPARGLIAENEVREPLAKDTGEARGPAQRDRRPESIELPTDNPDEERQAADQAGDGGLKARLRSHLIAIVIGLIVLAAAVAGGTIYLAYAEHFESTDDAFIASRQFAIAPKVSGYITAVPVTDNQHVAGRDVIARIDDRDYRVALAQAKAQVTAAQASIENIDAQLDVQQAQIAANQAQVGQAQA